MAGTEHPISEEANFDKPESAGVVLFDGVCNLCNAAINFVIDRDPRGYFQFGALQGAGARKVLRESGLDLDPAALESLVLIEQGRVYTKSTAALRIARRLTGGWSLLWGLMLVPRVLRDAVYSWIARRRYDWFGKREACRVPTPELKARFLDR